MSKQEKQNRPNKKVYRTDTAKINPSEPLGHNNTLAESAGGDHIEPKNKPDSLPLKRSSPFPVDNWDRYEFVDFIGEGGMGRVYKARDSRLNRYVALKFIRDEDPELLERFFLEARAQARIEHPNVCKVYEAGEVEGRPYIAMQYIEGRSLKTAKDSMNLEEKLRVMKQVCEGIHEAHRLGLIHRDVKPANIMVERDGEGNLHPYVMDFGLVREMNAEGKTTTGAVMGTPSYMSPEQARGETRLLDRRTDVYGLGAALYAALVGRPPFQGDSGIRVVIKVLQEEPEPIRSIDASIPVDVETIVMKCLMKEPQLRYESAKAAAEDLQLYLDGEPIKARRTSWTYWALKKAKKNKTAVAAMSFAIIAVIVFGAMRVNANLMAAKQTFLAQQFGQETERIEGILRYAHMMPLHDVRREKAIVQLRMKGISELMKQAGAAGEGPGNFALGRGYLVLHDYEKAREYLERALKSGFQTPEVKYALGLAMGALYQEQLASVERITSDELREARKRELDAKYREPALEYVKARRQVQKDGAAYVEGLIAFYEKRYEDALKKVEESLDRSPWMYEAKKLEGDIYMAPSNDKFLKGDYEGVMADYDKAGEAYRAAMEIGHSDPTLYEAECSKQLGVMNLLKATGKSSEEAFQPGLSICEKALKADPERGGAYVKTSMFYYALVDYLSSNGKDPLSALEKTIETGRKAIQWSPQDEKAYSITSSAYCKKAEYEFRTGDDLISSIEQAIDAGEKALLINSNSPLAINTLGKSYNLKSKYERKKGLDPRSSSDRAIEYFRKESQLVPTNGRHQTNIGIVYNDRSEYEIENGVDPTDSHSKAIESFRKSIELNSNNYITHNCMGNAYLIKSRYEMMTGSDPRTSLDLALESYRKAAQINPKSASVYANIGSAYMMKGQYETENPSLSQKGVDPELSLNEGKAAFQRSIGINPNEYETYVYQAKIDLISAQRMIARNRSPESFFGKAGAALRKALELNPESADIYQAQAELHFQQALRRLQDKAAAMSNIRKGLDMVEKSISINPKFAEAVAVKGKLILLQARIEQDDQKRTVLARNAQAILEQAIQINRLLKAEAEKYLKEAQLLARR